MKYLKYLYNLVVVFLIFIAVLFIVSVVPINKNIKILMVSTGSMEPAIHTGSLVVIKQVNDYKEGDIITFGKISKTETPVTHRIHKIKDNNGNKTYVTKGDANNAPDLRDVQPSEIFGKVLFSLPALGYIIDFAKKPIGFMIMIIGPAIIIIYDELKKIAKEVKRIRDSKKEKKEDKDNNTSNQEEIKKNEEEKK